MKELPSQGATNPRDVASAINQLIRGRSNAVILVTLTAGVTSTVVTAATALNLNESAYAFPCPLTANAAAAMATTYAVITRVSGQLRLTVTHANAATTDRSFAYLICGG